MLSEEVPAINEAGVEAPAVQRGDGISGVEGEGRRAAYTILAEFKSCSSELDLLQSYRRKSYLS